MTNSIKRLLLILCVLVACVGCDQSTKYLAEASLPKAHAISLWGDTVRLQVAHNEGAFLNAGDSLPKAWRTAALRGGVAVALLLLLGYTLRVHRATPRIHIVALSLILAGGVGNLIDRFAHDGYVVDFLNVGLGPLRTGIFNVADVALMLGALVLVLPMARGRPSAG